MGYSIPGRGIVKTVTEGSGPYTFGDPIGDTFQLPTDSPQVTANDKAPFWVVDSLEAPTKVEMNRPATVTATTQARDVVRSYDPDNGGWGTGPINWGQETKFIVYDLDPDTLSKLLMLVWNLSHDHGTVDSGTLQPEPTDGQFQQAEVDGAITFAAPAATGPYAFFVTLTMGSSAGTVTFSGFDEELGDSLDTTDGNKFELAIVCDALGEISVQVRAKAGNS